MSIIIQGFPNNGAYTQDDIRGYKVYTAALYQIGTNPLQAYVYENTIDPAANWVTNISSPGQYELYFPSLGSPFNGAKFYIPNSGTYTGNNNGYSIISNASLDIYYYTLYVVAGTLISNSNYEGYYIRLDVYDSTNAFADLSTALGTPTDNGTNGTINIEIRLYP